MSSLRMKVTRNLVLIGILHTILLVTTGVVIYRINEAQLSGQAVPSGELWANVALFGFIGSLLYFSRKVYTYLMTDKVGRVVSDLAVKGGDDAVDAAMVGYYWYLAVRPLVGLAIGPLVTFIVLGGLNTIAKAETAGSLALSDAGICAIYVLTFVGGYTASDLLDGLSRIGGRLIISARADR